MLAKIKKIEFKPERKNPTYHVKLECPNNKELEIEFDFTHSFNNYMPLKVLYDGKDMGAKLAWYTQEVENMTVRNFLGEIATIADKKYSFELKE